MVDQIRRMPPFGSPKREERHDQTRRNTGGDARSQVDPPHGGTDARVPPRGRWRDQRPLRLDTIGEPELTGAFRKWIGLAVARRFGEAGKELERKVMEEEKGTMTLLERAREWGKEYDRQWMEKLEKGVQRGIARERQASIQRECELVHRMVTRKFGPGTSQQLRAILDHISDPDDIAPIADAVIECETAEDFLERVRGD